jgi:hypothetical protein
MPRRPAPGLVAGHTESRSAMLVTVLTGGPEWLGLSYVASDLRTVTRVATPGSMPVVEAQWLGR